MFKHFARLKEVHPPRSSPWLLPTQEGGAGAGRQALPVQAQRASSLASELVQRPCQGLGQTWSANLAKIIPQIPPAGEEALVNFLQTFQPTVGC